MIDLSKKKILNIAWIGQGDFGDEVMGFVLRQYLKGRGAESITYYEKGDRDIYKGENDLQIKYLHKYNTPRLFKKILDNLYLRNFDVVIVGGGSILHSVDSILWKQTIVNKIKNNTNAKLVALGVSLGPFTKDEEKKICGTFLDKLDGSVMRDNCSAILGIKNSVNKNILSSLDSSFLLPYYYNQKVFRMADKRDKDVVALMFVWNKSWPDEFFYKNYFYKYLSIVDSITKIGKCVKLISLYTGDAYRDNEVIREIYKKATSPDKISHYIFNGDIFDTIDVLNSCGYSLSMRLHGVIFSYILGIPFLSLGYDQKNINFCGSVRYDITTCFDFINLNKIESVCDRLYKLFDGDVSIFSNSLSCTDCSVLVKDNFDKIFSLI